MRRFHLPPEDLKAGHAVINGPDANHIKNVLRLKPGQTIAVFDGQGAVCKAVITDMSASAVNIAIQGKPESETKSPVAITLAMAMLKSGKMDDLVRRITELGISRWLPFMAERSIPILDSKRTTKKQARWETIAREALKQCQRNKMPDICSPATFDHVLAEAAKSDLSLIFWEQKTGPIYDLLSLRETNPCPKTILIMVGPEGGFSPAEIRQAGESGIIRVSLGPRILRAETAALTACALVQFLFGDLRQKTS